MSILSIIALCFSCFSLGILLFSLIFHFIYCKKQEEYSLRLEESFTRYLEIGDQINQLREAFNGKEKKSNEE